MSGELAALEPFVGQWRMAVGSTADPAEGPRALTTFEWMRGGRFLIQRWELDLPDAPDEVALIGLDGSDPTGYLQHYFDSRGVMRVYEMGFGDGRWTFHRSARPPDLSQRFTGHFDEDLRTIVGRWEVSHDGSNWSSDFDLAYVRVA